MRALYRLFRPTGRELIIGSCPPFFTSLPMHPYLSEADQERIISALT
jgi:hypothetical protein